ncbi:AAA family ATPase [Chitinophaga horti]|uniref:AAA family ATPase n=1 Tax=Chitinophaga horti TaxID=2920382 RepID=A0ABY6J360_9BACT|nr:AAA family ATPase [Chitinophaga horti]UYQ92612.1 AAA family ATPase [Chitinophaga horti]
MEEGAIIDTFQPATDFSALHNAVAAIREEIGKVVVGQHQMVDLLITGLLTNGHVLIEGVPGVAKTLASKLLAQTIDAKFSRIQFTPDMMPADVLGTSVFNPQSREFEYKRGPIFGNLILIDEINRAPAKTQSALFEVMEERQITNDGNTHAGHAVYGHCYAKPDRAGRNVSFAGSAAGPFPFQNRSEIPAAGR